MQSLFSVHNKADLDQVPLTLYLPLTRALHCIHPKFHRERTKLLKLMHVVKCYFFRPCFGTHPRPNVYMGGLKAPFHQGSKGHVAPCFVVPTHETYYFVGSGEQSSIIIAEPGMQACHHAHSGTYSHAIWTCIIASLTRPMQGLKAYNIPQRSSHWTQYLLPNLYIYM